jgi:hypothetical protein
MYFYTYAYLREDRTPYYIGKGKGNRISHRKKRDVKPPKDKSRIIFLKQNLTEEEAFKHEIYMIAVFGRKDNGTGILHNRTDGGEGPSGFIHTPETKAKLSAIKKGENHPNYGKPHSPETKAKMSVANKGRKHTPEAISKISAAGKGKNISPEQRVKMSDAVKGEKNHNYGKSPSEESRKKMSEAQKGEKNHASKWWKITFVDGTEIIICGLTGWTKENGYVYSSVYRVYTGKCKRHKDIIKVEVIS